MASFSGFPVNLNLGSDVVSPIQTNRVQARCGVPKF